MYLTTTGPDLTYVVHILSRFMQAPRLEHMDVARRVLRYLKGTAGQGILLKANSNLQLVRYCDSDWGICPVSCKLLLSYFVMLGGSPISWKSMKQITVSCSSAKAEYLSMAFPSSELIWIRSFLASLGVFLRSMNLFCDNQAALHIARNPIFHERTKHIKIDYHFC